MQYLGFKTLVLIDLKHNFWIQIRICSKLAIKMSEGTTWYYSVAYNFKFEYFHPIISHIIISFQPPSKVYKAAKNHFFDHRISENYVPSAFWEKKPKNFVTHPLKSQWLSTLLIKMQTNSLKFYCNRKTLRISWLCIMELFQYSYFQNSSDWLLLAFPSGVLIKFPLILVRLWLGYFTESNPSWKLQVQS